MLIEVRGGAIRCFSAPQGPICFSPSVTLSLSLEDARHCSAPPPRAARRSIRLLCVLTVCLLTRTGSCLVAAVRRCKGGDGRGERGRARRLFEVTEIATTPAWRRSRRRTGGSCRQPAFSNFTARLGLMWISDGMLCADVRSEKGACVCVRGQRWRCSRISACFWRLCGQFYGAAGYWGGKRGLDEHRTVALELKNCISCHTSSSSPIQVAATTPEIHLLCS